MRIFNSEAAARINGNYGTTPDMASLWVAGTGVYVPGYTINYGLNFNFSSSIPETYIGFEIWTTMADNGNRWSQITALIGYGLNAGGTSIAPNNQNYDWYTNNNQNNAGNALYINFDGGNRRLRIGIQNFDANATQLVYVRMVCRYISYVTVTWA